MTGGELVIVRCSWCGAQMLRDPRLMASTDKRAPAKGQGAWCSNRCKKAAQRKRMAS